MANGTIFLKENPLYKILTDTIHEVGHIIYHTPDKNFDKEIYRNLSEAFAISFEIYGMEMFNTLNYNKKYNMDAIKDDIKNYSNHNNDGFFIAFEILKSLTRQFPTMKDMCFFLKDSTEKEILEKAEIKDY